VIVVDTNVIAYLFLKGIHTKRAERALGLDPVWAAPFLWRAEFRNVLALYQRQGLLRLQGALQIAGQSEAFMKGREYFVAASQVLTLAANSRCSAYDCEFVALAQELGVPLLTTDRQVLSAFPNVSLSLEQFVT